MKKKGGRTKHGVESKKKRREEGKRRAELESSSKKPIESVQWLRAILPPPPPPPPNVPSPYPELDRPPQPFNLCIANATPFLPRPSVCIRVAEGERKEGGTQSSRDCYFNEISLNGGPEEKERNGG